MSTENKIIIKQAILLFPEIAAQLKRNSKTVDIAIEEFAEVTGLQPVFIKQNIDQIRNWI